ncbi:MAG: hypothetical protein ACRET6_12645, partial [Burkholderiales bacterium]
MSMFKNDGLFGKLEDAARKDPRSSTPAPGQTPPPAPRAPYPEPAKQEAAAARGDGKGSKLI